MCASYNNFQVKRNKNTKNVGVFDKSRDYHKSSENMTKDEKLMEGVAIWASYYQSRPDVFCDEYLGISLKPFQKILIYCMMHYNYTAFFASRGLGKTFLTAIFCVIICILKPGKLVPLISAMIC